MWNSALSRVRVATKKLSVFDTENRVSWPATHTWQNLMELSSLKKKRSAASGNCVHWATKFVETWHWYGPIKHLTILSWQFPRLLKYAEGMHRICLPRVICTQIRHMTHHFAEVVRRPIKDEKPKIKIQTFTEYAQYFISLFSLPSARASTKLKGINHSCAKVYNGVTACCFEQFRSSIFLQWSNV